MCCVQLQEAFLLFSVMCFSLAHCCQQKVESPISFFVYAVFEQVLIKIMHMYVIHRYVYVKVTISCILYRIITLGYTFAVAVGMNSTQKF
jgi:hypothetical protein